MYWHRREKISSKIKSNTFDEVIYSKLKEVELEMNNTSKRHTMKEMIESMNSIIDKD